MNYSKTTRSFAYDLVNAYAKFNGECYELDIGDVDEFDLEKITSLMMAEHRDWANEATGPDNPAYEDSMLPALLIYLEDTFSPEAKENFDERWKRGMVSYAWDQIEKLLDEQLNEYNWEYAA